MMSSLLGPLLLLFLCNSVRMNSVVVKHYVYHLDHRTWEEAQSYCRGSGRDLAFMNAEWDVHRMSMTLYRAWIGIYKDSSGDWMWPNGGSHSIDAWCRDEPHSSDTCAFAYSVNKNVYGTHCQWSIFFFCQSGGSDSNVFIPVSMVWADAWEYCERFHDRMSTFSDDGLAEAVVQQDFPVWTGLHRNGGAWEWSKGVSNFTIWGEGQPNNMGDCVSISSMGKLMATQNCTDRFPFVCFTDNLVVVTESMTWEEALEHCRSMEVDDLYGSRYEMVSVQPGDDHAYFKLRKEEDALTDQVWTGLRFLAGHWMWINKVQQLPPGLPLYPPADQHCGTLSSSDDVVEIRDCSEKWNFMCYRK